MKFGDWGEKTAAKYLTNKGYKIIEVNFRCKVGELDIIAIYEGVIIFVEVKTRNNMNYGLPCESITRTKLKHLYKTIKFYTMINDLMDRELRLDIIEILMLNGRGYINHIEDIGFVFG